MCEYIDMLEARGEARGKKIGKRIGKKVGKEIGKEIGEKIGERRLAKLINNLVKEKKYREIEEASNDRKRRQELYRQYGIL